MWHSPFLFLSTFFTSERGFSQDTVLDDRAGNGGDFTTDQDPEEYRSEIEDLIKNVMYGLKIDLGTYVDYSLDPTLKAAASTFVTQSKRSHIQVVSKDICIMDQGVCRPADAENHPDTGLIEVNLIRAKKLSIMNLQRLLTHEHLGLARGAQGNDSKYSEQSFDYPFSVPLSRFVTARWRSDKPLDDYFNYFGISGDTFLKQVTDDSNREATGTENIILKPEVRKLAWFARKPDGHCLKPNEPLDFKIWPVDSHPDVLNGPLSDPLSAQPVVLICLPNSKTGSSLEIQLQSPSKNSSLFYADTAGNVGLKKQDHLESEENYVIHESILITDPTAPLYVYTYASFAERSAAAAAASVVTVIPLIFDTILQRPIDVVSTTKSSTADFKVWGGDTSSATEIKSEISKKRKNEIGFLTRHILIVPEILNK